ncbi:hypothetical protein SSS_05496 [Sarcoptes scabiei]|nr:hypothetical protein SSS_05496 [Sarcoptes scabiei]
MDKLICSTRFHTIIKPLISNNLLNNHPNCHTNLFVFSKKFSTSSKKPFEDLDENAKKTRKDITELEEKKIYPNIIKQKLALFMIKNHSNIIVLKAKLIFGVHAVIVINSHSVMVHIKILI